MALMMMWVVKKLKDLGVDPEALVVLQDYD